MARYPLVRGFWNAGKALFVGGGFHGSCACAGSAILKGSIFAASP